jgi:hypothetical protein
MTALEALRIRKRPRWTKTLAGVLLTVGLVAGGGAASASSAATSPAGQSTHATPATNTGFCHDPKIGGTFYCDLDLGWTSGEATWTFPNKTTEKFVIGTNAAVWTAWSNTSGGWTGWTGWTSMGGVATAYPPQFYFGGKFFQQAGGLWTPRLDIVGADGGVWFRQRDTEGNWSAWKAGY